MAVRPIDGTWSKFVWNLSESESLARKFRDGKACLIDLRLAVEAQPTLTPPNEPLTIEQLRDMDGEPVWVIYDQDAAKTTPGFDPLALWALVEATKDSVFRMNNLGGRTGYADDQDLEWAGITVYRRPPEGEEGDANRG